jgi:hypothetical protein
MTHGSHLIAGCADWLWAGNCIYAYCLPCICMVSGPGPLFSLRTLGRNYVIRRADNQVRS